MARKRSNRLLRMFLGTAGIIVGGLIIASTADRGDNLPAPGMPVPVVPGPQLEMNMKLRQVSEDVRLTESLCRSQCTLDYRRMVQKLQASNASNLQGREELVAMHEEHPHMHQLVWTPNLFREADDAVTVGNYPEPYTDMIERYYEEARQAAINGKEYQSPPVGSGQDTYFVIGVPSQNGSSSLMGVVHQDLLARVEAHQIKNLRAVEYPNDKNWKIEAVDPGTLRKLDVDHPEQNEGVSHYLRQEVVVGFKGHPSDDELEQMKKDVQARSVEKVGNTYVFESDGLSAKEMMTYFQKHGVRYVEPHFLYISNQGFEPNDALYSRYQWNLPQIETPEGWSVSQGSKDVVVGIIDTGIDLEHPDLKSNIQQGLNLVDKDMLPADDVGHGTHVAGVISALINNGEGVAGMSWRNPVMPIKALDHTGAGSTYTVAQGIIWATDQGAKVINMSLGNYANAQFLHDAIRYAFDRDVVLIAASGNDNTEQPGFPAAYPEVFAVGATDSQLQKASFSNYGDYIDVAAPGVSIASTYPDNQYAALSGTSMASPHVAALAALIRSVNPSLKNTEVMEIMRRTAVDLGPEGKDKYFGYGMIDVVKALSQARQANHSLTLTTQRLEEEVTKIEQKYKKIAR
jgi:thermitase